jgi:hypothetical protein
MPRCRREFLQWRWRPRPFMPLRRPAEERVLCFAHVTNQMGLVEGDFEKGAADGARESLQVGSLAAERWRAGEPLP